MKNEENRFQHLPAKVGYALERIEEVFGITFTETEVILRNLGGWAYAKGWGVEYSYCTFSYMDGPHYDYHDEFDNMLRGLGFDMERSFGDNGLDSSTNWHDTYWSYQYVYKKSVQYIIDDEEEVDKYSQPIFEEDNY